MAQNIDTVLHLARNESEQERLRMILGNRIDHGSEAGGLTSVKQFDALIGDLLRWRDVSIAEGYSPRADAQEEGNWQ